MIIGNGLIAKSLKTYFETDLDFIVFASGVSNSSETSECEFLRERSLLLEAIDQNKFLLYFSTCSIYDTELNNSLYVKHKKEMEVLVSKSRKYLIFRLPQVVGKTENPNTLTNYIYNHIIQGVKFRVWKKAYRNIIDVKDVATIVNYLVRSARVKNQIINVACPFSISISTLVSTFESALGVAAQYDLIDLGGSYQIDTSLVSKVAQELDIDFDVHYVNKLIRKYYS